MFSVVAALLQDVVVGYPECADAVVDQLESGTLQGGAYQLDALAAPAIAAKGGGFLLAELKSLHHAQQTIDGVAETVVDGGRAYEDGLRAEHLGGDVVLVGKGGVEELDFGRRAGLTNAVGDGFGHEAGGLPHGVVDYRDAILLVVGGPGEVALHNLCGIVAPDDAVTGAYHRQRQLHGHNLVHLAESNGTVGVEDVGIVFHCLVVEFRGIDAVVVEAFGGVVLAKSVVAEEDAAVAVEVGKHRVGPMEHGGFDEGERGGTEGERITGFDVDEVPVLMIVSADDGLAFGGAVDGGVGDESHQFG